MAFPDDWAGYDSPSALLAPNAGVSNFTYLVSLNQMSATWWSNVKSDGGDIRATKGDGTTELPCDLIHFDYATQSGLLAVKYTGTQTTSPDNILIWCGNASATLPSVSDTYGQYNAYDSYWSAFYPDGAATDRTFYARDLTMAGSPSVGGAAGPINGSKATDYDGSTQYGYDTGVTMPDSVVWSFFASGECDDNLNQNHAIGIGNGSSDQNQWRGLNWAGNSSDKIQVDTGWRFAVSTTAYSVDTWHRGAGVSSGTSSRAAYIDGGSKGTNTQTNTPGAPNRISVAGEYRDGSGPYGMFDGSLSLLSVHRAARSDDWVAYDAAMIDATDSDQSAFYGTWSWTAAGGGGGSTGGAMYHHLRNMGAY